MSKLRLMLIILLACLGVSTLCAQSFFAPPAKKPSTNLKNAPSAGTTLLTPNNFQKQVDAISQQNQQAQATNTPQTTSEPADISEEDTTPPPARSALTSPTKAPAATPTPNSSPVIQPYSGFQGAETNKAETASSPTSGGWNIKY